LCHQIHYRNFPRQKPYENLRLRTLCSNVRLYKGEQKPRIVKVHYEILYTCLALNEIKLLSLPIGSLLLSHLANPSIWTLLGYRPLPCVLALLDIELSKTVC